MKGTARYRDPGYVALAVAGEKGTETKEVSTGLGGDREANMVSMTSIQGFALADCNSGPVCCGGAEACSGYD